MPQDKIQTRSAAAKADTESVSGPTRRVVYEQPPASPSVVNITTTAEGGAPSSDPATTGQITDAVTEGQSQPTIARIPSRAASVRSTSSATARLRQAEFEAEQRLMEIKRRELQLEAELIKKKLAWDVAVIQETDNESLHEIEDSNVRDRIGEWLSRNERTNEPPSERQRDNATTAAAPTAADAAAAAPALAYRSTRARGEQTPHAHERSQQRSPTPHRERQRSPTPSRYRGFELLAEAIQNIAHVRTSSRQATELPTFSGAAAEWLPFKAAMVETSKTYKFTPSENLARLRNCLRGEAKETVSAMLATCTDPSNIMKTLEQCYGRPEVILDQAMEEMRRLPKPGPAACDLNRLAVKLQNIVCVMTQMDRRGYLNNPMLAREVINKLSPHTAARWCDYAERHGSYSEPEIITLSKFLMREADQAMRHTYVPMQASQSSNMKKEERKPVSRSGIILNRRVAAHSTSTTIENTRCPGCNEEHKLTSCPKFTAMSINDRWQLVKNEKLCFKCISARHRRGSCRATPCGQNNCHRPHHRLLHADQARSDSLPVNALKTDDSEHEAEAVATTAVTTKKQVLLKVCPVIVKGPAGEMNTYALLDEGSTVTLIDRDLAKKLQLRGPAQNMHIHGVNSATNEKNSERVKLQVRGMKTSYFDLEARTISDVTLRGQTVPESVLQYPHLQKLDVKEVCYDLALPKLLIGADHWHLIVSRQLYTGKKKEPVASRTSLGWVVLGNLPRATLQQNEEAILHLQVTEPLLKSRRNSNRKDERLEELIKLHYDIDALGVSLTKKVKTEDERAMKIVKETTRYSKGKYVVGLPWRRDDVTMPPSYNSALKRLKGIEKKMDNDAAFATEYTAQIENLLAKGYATKCDGTEAEHPRKWYLPHFAVRNPNKPGKIRLVFDAAAVTNDVSLNKELLEGPDLLTSLHGVLFRFREEAIAVTSDIQEMFLQIKIQEADQPAQMFLWRGKERTSPPRKYKMTSMIFGAASSPFIAHSIRNHNAEVHAHTNPEAVVPITKSHYMDDYVDSYSTEEEAIRIIRSVDEVHKKAGFTLRGWNSNSARVLSSVPMELRAHSPTELRLKSGTYDKTLGLLWDADEDSLRFNTRMMRVPQEIKSELRVPTKREALSAVMSIYDPLGLLSPFTIAAKIHLQELWRLKTGWDETLPEPVATLFLSWLRGLDHVEQITIPRCYQPSRGQRRRDLHIFCDASESAYAATAYWRIELEDGAVHTTLVTGKAKVAPLKPQSIPRLELQAAVIATRLADTIKQEHRWVVDDTIYWTDSTTVLAWIRNDARRYTPFVAHRLGEIAERSEPAQWRWVPSELNVADDATRTKYANCIPARWFTGPTYLLQSEDEWPGDDDLTPETPLEEVAVYVISITTNEYEVMPDAARISKYERLIRATAYVLLAADKWRKRATELQLRHLQQAEDMWLRRAQHESFPDEIACLIKGAPLHGRSKLYKLDPELVDGLLRVRGRINAADVPKENKKPIILDGRHCITRMIIEKEHCAAEHANNERVINELRQRYWILRIRPQVRAVARTCKTCQLRKKKPDVPAMGDLPRERLSPYSRPFTHCGIDYFGPMTITIGRRHEKRWGALFTCLTTRAVHMEIVASLSTDSAIMALRRMAARRGWPAVIISDNGTNFRGADKELREAVEEWAPHLKEYLFTRRVQWKFIPPGAPNQGGAWERLVRSIKTALAATLHEKAPRDEVLQTLIVEAEHSVNSRPLTHVSVNSDDEESLTPNHFLLGTSSGLPLNSSCQPGDRRLWRAAQALANSFWQRWLKEYLPTLIPRGQPGKESTIKEGDLVIIVDSNLPRNVWPRGVVERVHPGADGEVRNVDVRTKGGVFRRPTRRLIVLNTETIKKEDAVLPNGEGCE